MKTRILLIDDDADFTHWLQASLEMEGYFEVQVENDATRAQASAREFAPDLIVLDIMMPDIDGSELALRFKLDRTLSGVPLLFLTALVSGDEAPGGAFSSGGHTFLPKSISLENLLDRIQSTLRDRELAAAC